MNNIWNSATPKWLGLGLLFFGIAFSIGIFANQYVFAKDYRKPEYIPTLIQQARDAWVARDADAIAKLFTPDAEFIVPGVRWQGQAKIREEVAHFTQQYSDVKIDIRRIIIQGDRAAVEWYYSDTEKATGQHNKSDDVIIIDFKDGRISRWREYFDNKTPNGKPQ